MFLSIKIKCFEQESAKITNLTRRDTKLTRVDDFVIKNFKTFVLLIVPLLKDLFDNNKLTNKVAITVCSYFRKKHGVSRI